MKYLAGTALAVLGIAMIPWAAQADTTLLVPQTPIVVPGGAAKFDYMAMDTRNHRILASHPGASKLVVYDLTAQKVSQLDTDVEINGIAVDRTDNKLFTAGGGGKIVVFDLTTLAKVDEVTLSGPGDDIVYDRTNDTLYVDHDDGTEVWTVDAKTDKVTGSIPVAGAPEFVLYDRDSDKIYQNIKTANEIQEIDPGKNAIVATWPTAPMTSPHGLAIDSDSRRLFSAGDGKVDVIDMNSGKVMATVDIASGYVDQIVFDPTNKRLYCASRVGAISVVQETPSGATLAGIVTAPADVHTITVDRDTHSVWICYFDKTDSYLQEYKQP